MKIFRKMLVTKWLLVAIDFHRIDFHYSMYFFIKVLNNMGVNYGIVFIFGWTLPLSCFAYIPPIKK